MLDGHRQPADHHAAMTAAPPPTATDDPFVLLQQLGAALRMAKWQGLEVVPRAAPVVVPQPKISTPQHPQHGPAGQTQIAPQRASQPMSALALGLTASRDAARATLDDIARRASSCTKCARSTGRLRVVQPFGNPQAKLLVVLDAPSQDDERADKPAHGEAGVLLDRMLAAMGLHRDDVWLTYLCLCRDRTDAAVTPDQALACSGWLRQQFAAIAPQALVVFGQAAAQYLLRSSADLAQLRGQWGEARGVPVLATWGLQDVLADPSKKREVWADLQQVMARLGTRR